MYINSKHLQIFYFIKSNNDFNFKNICEVFNLSQQRAKLFIEDIYFEFFGDNYDKKNKDEMLKNIRSFKGGNRILRKVQIFTKQQNIFYLLFFLGMTGHFKMSNISKKIDITSRNLNNYSHEIKNILFFFNLDILVSNTGIELSGSKHDKKKFKFFLYLKFLIEKDYLPKLIRRDFIKFCKIKDFYILKKEIKTLALEADLGNTAFSKKVLFAQHLAFHTKNKSNFFLKILQEFETSTFLNADKVNNIFKNHLPETNNPLFFNILNYTVAYCELKEILFIDDFTFLELNLSCISDSNFLKLTKEIQKIIPKFNFFESLILWYSYNDNKEKIENNIFVYKNISYFIINNLIAEIQKKHNLKISEGISYFKLKDYLKENTVDNIFLIENINLKIKNMNIKNLYIPFQNYKKI
ncbi:MAG: hypothetical protein ACRC0R_01800 [Cetobacterium sp.]